ncbi:unnamed protein product [Rotaria sp. Silwood1]|nr:unnamed protein product [Rotaria sp. Silwood1]
MQEIDDKQKLYYETLPYIQLRIFSTKTMLNSITNLFGILQYVGWRDVRCEQTMIIKLEEYEVFRNEEE